MCLLCRGMFNREVIGKMKKGSYLVNNARGGIVDREAVLEACKSGHLAGSTPKMNFICRMCTGTACRLEFQ